MTTINKKSVSQAATTCALALCVVLCAGSAHAADDYLSAIEAEGNRIEFLGKARQEEEAVRRQQHADPPATTRARARNRAAAPADIAGFENQLRSRFPGSFALYSLMDTKQREAIYAEYRESKSAGSARFLPVLSKIIGMATKQDAKDN